MAFGYILRDRNGRFYFGSTNNLDRRLKEHLSGHSLYTSNVLPVELIFSQEFEDISNARKAETWLKKQKNSNFINKIVDEGKIEKNFR
jgi:putative endonuclease